MHANDIRAPGTKDAAIEVTENVEIFFTIMTGKIDIQTIVLTSLLVPDGRFDLPLRSSSRQSKCKMLEGCRQRTPCFASIYDCVVFDTLSGAAINRVSPGISTPHSRLHRKI